MRPTIAAIGGSLGGVQALARLLRALPPDFDLPLACVLHRGPGGSVEALLSFLRGASHLDVREAEDRDLVEPGRLYLAPGDYHLLVDGDRLALSLEKPLRHARPSIDVLFESVADSRGAEAAGIVLSGANADGAAGLARIAGCGGRVLVQDPETAEAPRMPREALGACPEATVAPPEELGRALGRLVSERHA